MLSTRVSAELYWAIVVSVRMVGVFEFPLEMEKKQDGVNITGQVGRRSSDRPALHSFPFV